MNILTTLPLDTFVAAAFAELLEDVTNLLAAAQAQKPCDKDEISFWKRQLNALNKAESYWRQGVRPTISANAYLLASASRPGALVHRLTRQGGILLCSCEAGQKGTLCWHHMLVNVLERAAEMEGAALKEAELVSGGSNDPNPIPHAAEAAAWVGAQITLTQRLAATAQLLDTLRAAQGRTAAPTAMDEPRRLGVRLSQARKKSAYFASAFYLEAA
jgi:hypothetical protein